MRVQTINLGLRSRGVKLGVGAGGATPSRHGGSGGITPRKMFEIVNARK
jgi:hypothetical protein